VGWADRAGSPSIGTARSARSARSRPARAAVALAVLALAVLAPALTAWAQEGPAQPAPTRAEVREVMARPEFSYEPSIVERIGNWLSDVLDSLFPESSGGPGGGVAGGVGPLVAWAVIAAAVVAAVLVVVAVVRRRVPRPDDHGSVTEAEIEHRRTATEWERDAERLEREGAWKDALRARYRQLVRTLVDRRQLPDVPGRTTGELRADLHRTTPGADDAFDPASLLFELAWYADVPTGEDENRRFRDLAARVLAVAPDDRVERVAVVLDGRGTPDEGGVVEVGR
jgi:hypothetical protein